MAVDERDIARFFWDDCTKVIAAGKVQRWEVLKWAVTVNVTLAAAIVAIKSPAAVFLFLLAAVVALVGQFLITHYNDRLTQMRIRTNRVVDYFFKQDVKGEKIDVSTIIGDESKDPSGRRYEIGAAGPGILYKPEDIDGYDRRELNVFRNILVLSMLPVLLASAVVLFPYLKCAV